MGNGVGYHHGVGFGYSGYHHPYTTYFGKRSADAEPEPFVTYGAYGYGLHHGVGYSGFYHPYSTTYYGKRSAEADPYYMYNGYTGLGLGHHHGFTYSGVHVPYAYFE